MALPDLTPRERLALDLEHTTENLWVLVDRDAPIAGEKDAPAPDQLAALANVMRYLDSIGAELAPDLYRAAEKRRGILGIDTAEAGRG